MTPAALKDISESLVEFNRIRYKNELAQAIYDLMRKRGVKPKKLGELLGVNKSRVSAILSGEKNLGADTLADVLLVLGRTPHLMMDTNFNAITFSEDRGRDPQESFTATKIATTHDSARLL